MVFKACLDEALDPAGAADALGQERWKLAAALELCIDRAIEQVDGRVVATWRASVAPARIR
jgi:hypothetical protein